MLWSMRIRDPPKESDGGTAEPVEYLEAKELQGFQHLRVWGAAWVTEADQEVVGADLAMPGLDPLDAVVGRAEDEAFQRDPGQVEVLLLFDVLVVRAVPPVVPVPAEPTGLVPTDRLLPCRRDEAFAEHHDLVCAAPALGGLAVERNSPLQALRELERAGQQRVPQAARPLPGLIAQRGHPDWGMRLLHRLRCHHHVLQRVALSHKIDLLFCPRPPEDLDAFLE